MDPIRVSTNISLPREQIFEYLLDIGNHAEFSDHYMVDWRLLRVESQGVGAGARFRIKQPLNRFSWADLTIADAQFPFKLVLRGRGGKFNRIKTVATYELFEGQSADSSKLEYSYETDAHIPSDVIPEVLGGRAWTKRKTKKAIKRLRLILEEDRKRGSRPTVAAR